MNEYSKLILNVIQYYDLGNFQEFLEILKEGDNLVLKFKTTIGVFVLKQYLRDIRLNKLIENLKFVGEFLGENPDYPLPVCMAKNGNYYIEIENKFYTIDKFEVGGKYGDFPSLDRLRSLAKILAVLHSKSKIKLDEEVKVKKVNNLHLIERCFKANKHCNDVNGYFGYIINKGNNSEFNLFLINQVIPLFREEYLRLKEGLKFIKPKKYHSMVHGDTNPYNIIFNDVEVVGLIDYELMYYDFAGYELVKTVGTFVNFHSEKGYNLDEIKTFVLTYRKIYGELDISGLEVLTYLRHSILELLSHFFNSYVQKKYYNSPPEKVIPFFYSKLKWIYENEGKVVKLFNV